MKNIKIINDKNYLFKLYDNWCSKFLREDVIFFGLTINLYRFYVNANFLNSFNSIF